MFSGGARLSAVRDEIFPYRIYSFRILMIEMPFIFFIRMLLLVIPSRWVATCLLDFGVVSDSANLYYNNTTYIYHCIQDMHSVLLYNLFNFISTAVMLTWTDSPLLSHVQ